VTPPRSGGLLASAVARVLRAPGLVVLVVALHLLLAAAVGASTRSALGAAMGRYALVDGSRLWGAVFELIGRSPGLLEPILHLIAGSAVVALGSWTLLAAGVLQRLRAPAPLPRLAAAAVRGLPAVVAVTLWHLVPRAVLLAIAGALAATTFAGPWGPVAIPVLAVVLAFCACALDLARCDVVLHGGRRFHPMTAWRGFVHAAGRPAVLVPSMLASFGQLGCTCAVVVAGLTGLGGDGGAAIWLARALATLGIVLGLIRLAVAVEAGPRELVHSGPLSPSPTLRSPP
jgi:hypothetical protein